MKILNNNQLKILACIFMLIDHIGMIFFPEIEILRIIGRLAMPLFAFFIAEGAYHTRNKIKYLLTIGLFGIGISLVLSILHKKFTVNIISSFSLSLIMIFLFDEIRKYIYLKNKKLTVLFSILFTIYTTSLMVFIYYFYIEYRLYSILIPFILSLTQSKYYKNPLPSSNLVKALAFIFGYILCTFISYYFMPINTSLHIQKYGIFAVFFILLYNNKRGKLNLKYLFYIFYPTHLIILYLIYNLINYKSLF